MRANRGTAVVLAIAAAAMAQIAWADKPIILTELQVTQSVRAPLNTRGVAVVDGEIWTIDTQAGSFVAIQPSDERAIRSIPSRVTGAHAVVWDGSGLWTVGKETNTIQRVNREGRVVRTLRIPAEKTSAPPPIEALAWDGKFLWIATSGGWSSRVMRVDAGSGRILQSMFAEGVPRGLTSDGKYLWMATYNGENPALLVRWTLGDDAAAMIRSRVFVARLPGSHPTGLAYDGETLWYADQKTAAFRRLHLPR